MWTYTHWASYHGQERLHHARSDKRPRIGIDPEESLHSYHGGAALYPVPLHLVYLYVPP